MYHHNGYHHDWNQYDWNHHNGYHHNGNQYDWNHNKWIDGECYGELVPKRPKNAKRTWKGAWVTSFR